MATLKEMWDETGREQQQRQEEFAKLSPRKRIIQKIFGSILALLVLMFIGGLFGIEETFGSILLALFSIFIVAEAFKKHESIILNIFYALFGGLYLFLGIAGIFQ